jgi:hypothetical protein
MIQNVASVHFFNRLALVLNATVNAVVYNRVICSKCGNTTVPTFDCKKNKKPYAALQLYMFTI